MESYSSGRRGGPAKALVWETAARVRIPNSPPRANCTHPTKKNSGCVFFFLQECFGISFKCDIMNKRKYLNE